MVYPGYSLDKSVYVGRHWIIRDCLFLRVCATTLAVVTAVPQGQGNKTLTKTGTPYRKCGPPFRPFWPWTQIQIISQIAHRTANVSVYLALRRICSICTKTNSRKPGFGNCICQALWGICAAFSRLKDKCMKQYDTVNETTDSFIHYLSSVKV